MLEREPTQTAENAFIQVGDRRIPYKHQEWYTNKDVANAVGRTPLLVSTQLHRLRKMDESIEFTTLGDLNRKGKLAPIGLPQTIIYNEENFRKAVTAVASIETKPQPRRVYPEHNIHKGFPTSKEKKPAIAKEDNHSSFNPFSSPNLNAKKPQETHRTPPETLNIKDPRQILAEHSVIKALSHLENGTLSQVPHDLPKYLQENLQEIIEQKHIDSTFNPGKLLEHIFWDNSPIRLNRFFKVNLEAILYDYGLWDVIDTSERRLKEEKEIIEICNRLKEKGYDRERAAQELLDHFSIPPKPTQEGSSRQETAIGRVTEIVIVPNPKTQVALSPENPIPQALATAPTPPSQPQTETFVEPHVYTMKDLATEIAQAADISESAAETRIRNLLKTHPENTPKWEIITGKSGPSKRIFFTEKQRGNLLNLAKLITGRRGRGLRSYPPLPETADANIPTANAPAPDGITC